MPHSKKLLKIYLEELCFIKYICVLLKYVRKLKKKGISINSIEKKPSKNYKSVKLFWVAMPRLKGKGRDVVTARNNFVLKLVKCSESHDYAAQKRCHFLNFHANDPLYKFAKVIRKIIGMIQPHSICKHVICTSFLLCFYGAIINNG